MSWLKRETPETKAIEEQTSKLETARDRRKAAMFKLLKRLDQLSDQPGTPPFVDRKIKTFHGHDD